MKQTLLLTALLLLLSVPVARAGGANISWGDACWGDVGSTDYADDDPYGGGGYLFWQGELPTAVRNATWGQIKGLYR